MFGIIGGPLLAIPFGLVAKSRIRQSGGRLGGRGLATGGIVLGCVWLALIAIGVVLAVTGVFDSPSNASRYQGVEREVAAQVDDTEEAFSDGNGDLVCDQIFTERFADLITLGGEEPCAEQFDLEDGEIQVGITVRRITVSGDTATVEVTEGDTPERWTMMKMNGRWRIDNIETTS